MQEVINALHHMAETKTRTAQYLRRDGNHIEATTHEKSARNYRTAANLLALVYPSKKTKSKH